MKSQSNDNLAVNPRETFDLSLEINIYDTRQIVMVFHVCSSLSKNLNV